MFTNFREFCHGMTVTASKKLRDSGSSLPTASRSGMKIK
jgi:hypothetical protein